MFSLLDAVPRQDEAEAARALVQHLHDACALLQRSLVRLPASLEAELLTASAALTAELRQRRAAHRA